MFRSAGRFYAPLYINMNDVIFIEVFFKTGSVADGQIGKYPPGITSSAVISGEHVCGGRFPEAAGAAVADQRLFCI